MRRRITLSAHDEVPGAIFLEGTDKLIKLKLGIDDAEALARHCAHHQPNSSDFRENARLAEAMLALASAINDACPLSFYTWDQRKQSSPSC